MPTFASYDGTLLTYRAVGDGTPVVCLPGGPMLDSTKLGDLGGLAERVQTILPDYRGTGASQPPADTESYRCDRLVDDLEALRADLGVEQLSLLGHCAGANLAVLYATRHPERVAKVVLVTPSTQAVGITATAEMRRTVVSLRENEPWFPAASAAFERIQTGQAVDADWEAITPFTYGRWDAAAQQQHASEGQGRNVEAAANYGAPGVYDPAATRAALGDFGAPVLVLAGEVDVAAPPSIVAELAAMFADATLVIQPGGGHLPWLDDPDFFTATVGGFLA